MRAALEREGQRTFVYHTTSPDGDDKAVSMGGVQPDTGRNVNGLRQAVSILVETRGIGLGRAHLARRVHAHVTAALAAVEEAARQRPEGRPDATPYGDRRPYRPLDATRSKYAYAAAAISPIARDPAASSLR